MLKENSEQKLPEKNTLSREEALRVMLNNSPGIGFVTNRDGIIQEFICPINGKYENQDKYIQNNISDTMPPLIAEAVIKSTNEADLSEAGKGHCDYSIILPRGEEKHFSLRTKRVLDPEFFGFYAHGIHDITQQKIIENDLRAIQKELELANEKIRVLSQTDALTGIGNREKLNSVKDEIFNKSRKNNEGLSAIMFDIDHFKSANDGFGHSAGDEILKEVARLTQSTIRGEDLLVRYGGDEFLIIMSKSNLDEAHTLADRIRAAISQDKILANERKIRVTISAGVSTILETDKSIEDVAKRADGALYRAKKQGKNIVSI